MIIETTEKKIIEASWSNLMKEPGYFTRKFGRIKTVIAKRDIEEKASPNEVCTYELFYYPKATPDELNVIEEEVKKLEESQA